jgi:hypothetical protein
MKKKILPARNHSGPTGAVQSQRTTPPSGSQSFMRIIQTVFPRVSRPYSLSSIPDTLVSVERVTAPHSKLGKKDSVKAKVDAVMRSVKLSPEALQLWHKSEHLTIRKKRELWQQYPVEAEEIRRFEREAFQKLRPFRGEDIWPEEEYEKSYQAQKEEIIEEVVNGDVELLLFFLKFYGPRLLAEPRVLPLVQEWWLTKGKNEKARENLQKVCDVLSERVGRPETLTEEERTQRRAKSRLEDQQSRRAIQYYEKARQRYMKKQEDLKSKGILDKDILEQVREQIMAEEFSRGGEAKKEAKRLFLQKIKNEPSSVL